ncbi:PIN domain nuclease [Falsiroseomonas bella]|uniref:Ribonuclease VapC n=1 Tax=Falsiroseomonas bella TaxID=2184016 RepID=A0A317FI08_9PROT|nr:type II toxin-antitoxin system VapC family toxin [Falsiroseomonas bella]PWS38731.1 PIN domain nuclease [Falsiroseomonas bella]
MAFVIDASVVVKWVLAEADSDAALTLGRHRLLAPDLLDIECASVLWKAARRGELSQAEAAERLAVIGEAAIERLPDAVLLPGAMRHALQLGHPIYDCLYLEAAIWTALPLVTTDRRLARLAIPGCDIRLLETFR